MSKRYVAVFSAVLVIVVILALAYQVKALHYLLIFILSAIRKTSPPLLVSLVLC